MLDLDASAKRVLDQAINTAALTGRLPELIDALTALDEIHGRAVLAADDTTLYFLVFVMRRGAWELAMAGPLATLNPSRLRMQAAA